MGEGRVQSGQELGDAALAARRTGGPFRTGEGRHCRHVGAFLHHFGSPRVSRSFTAAEESNTLLIRSYNFLSLRFGEERAATMEAFDGVIRMPLDFHPRCEGTLPLLVLPKLSLTSAINFMMMPCGMRSMRMPGRGAEVFLS
jgi:hypothetical protein